MTPGSDEWFFAGAGRRGNRSTSGNLSKDMPDQPFLGFMDVFQQRGFVQCFECLDYFAQQTQYDQTYSPNKEQQSKNIT